MSRRPRHGLMLAAGLLLASPLALASAGAGGDARIERLLEAVIEMVPYDKVFDLLAAEDPAWPFTAFPGQVGDGQLACVRGELSSAGYRRYWLPLVTAYAERHPDRIDADLALLEGGAALLIGKLLLAGAEGAHTGVPADPERVVAGATPEQLAAVMAVYGDPAHAPLRELAGFGESLGKAETQAGNEAAGEAVGRGLGAMQLRRAITTCGGAAAMLP